MHDSEILVHIAAPSGARDDAKYRAQVAAILNFDVVSRQPIYPAENHHGPEGSCAGDSLVSSSASVPGGVDIGVIRECPASGDVVELSQSACLSAKADNGPITAPGICTGEQKGQSSPIPVPVSVPAAAESGAAAVAPRHRHCSDASLDSPVSVIPDSQPQSAVTTSGNQQLTQLSRREEGSADDSSQNHNAAPDSAQPTHSDKKSPPQTTEIVLQNRTSKPHRSKHTTTSLLQAADAITLDKLPLEIHPDSPKVSDQKFQTHITPTLKALAERMNLEKRYQPLGQTRAPASLERGYWLLKFAVTDPDPGLDADEKNRQGPNHWPMSLFRRFWSFLVAFITGNRAGWGTWCILESDDDDDDGSSPSGPKNGDDNCRHYRLSCKVYCWGEIVPHMYIVLFLATERRIKKMGAQWRDGADKVVVQMP